MAAGALPGAPNRVPEAPAPYTGAEGVRPYTGAEGVRPYTGAEGVRPYTGAEGEGYLITTRMTSVWDKVAATI